MNRIFTINNFFFFTAILVIVATILCYVSGAWNYVHPFVSASFEMLCGIFALYMYCTQSAFKRSRFTHILVAIVMSSLLLTLINDSLYTALCLANKGAKDDYVANRINALYDAYFAAYTILMLMFPIAISTFLFTYVSTGHNDFKK